jgi:hypothetical protein
MLTYIIAQVPVLLARKEPGIIFTIFEACYLVITLAQLLPALSRFPDSVRPYRRDAL